MEQAIWTPSEVRKQNSNIFQFIQLINAKYNRNFQSYDDLYQWSIKNISEFWSFMWDYAEIKASKGYDSVVDDISKMPGAHWFNGAELNFAENLLRYRDDEIALIFRGESEKRSQMTYSELYDNVARLAKSLRDMGVKAGDRVTGFVPNMPEAIIGMLAAVSAGAIWSSCSPDFGIKGVLDRFGQIKPKVLIVGDGYYFKGKKFDSLERTANIVKDIPSIEKVIVVNYTGNLSGIDQIPNAISYDDFISKESGITIKFEQLPAEHPLYIMYSSGTTGLPKCMVQSAAGILINHIKELKLHADLKRNDTIFYFTTCGWMMWNWLTTSLAVGATLVLYDGNPFHPHPGALWEMAQDEKISIFGTSAGYLSALEGAGVRPGKEYDLLPLRSVLSTGSPLSPEQFDFVYRDIKQDVQLASISGGSDLNGCFAGGNPIGPVYRGELQCRNLAMKVEAFDEKGLPVHNQKGELVCTAPFPSMPIYFWDDPDGKKYHAAYFDVFPNVWRHGDFIEITDTGGVIIYGRSDATLNPGGVRIGTAEIYRQMETIEEIVDSVVVGQDWKGDVRVILFVVMKENTPLTDAIKNEIVSLIRKNASPRHVPAKIIAVKGVPYTLNMKKVELAVRNIIQKKPVLNKDALANPNVLDYYKDIPELQI
ncbi:acetoacetate--CoA ligase [Desulfatiglans anilini]|uniref:acetoacetate--CoA ligase n=1 Tax=Desulfatiglans anilini TaxID=90728 RepID=UPI00047F973B